LVIPCEELKIGLHSFILTVCTF